MKVFIDDAIKRYSPTGKEVELMPDNRIRFEFENKHFVVWVEGDKLAIRKTSTLGSELEQIVIEPHVSNSISLK